MELVKIQEIRPYANNAKKHDRTQINNVAQSIKQFGFVQPIVIDTNGEIIIGHCRYEASKKLKLKEVPCVRLETLTEEEVKKLRNLDNKLNESEWDFDLLKEDLQGLDFDGFDVDWGIEFSDDEERMAKEFFEGGKKLQGNDESGEYKEFVEKFEPKLTTDDCYTPDLVYEAVANYVAEEYGLDRKNFVRPFYPGGDYQKRGYKKEDVVVDNPPFSILSQIVRFYSENGIKFFLFAPGLTIFNSATDSCCCCCGVSVTYENRASVNTSFVTNLENESVRFKSAPKLYKAVESANDAWLGSIKKNLPKYSYPMEVLSASMMNKFSKYGVELSISRESSYKISALDSQIETGDGIFGSGYLISETAIAERERAERERAIVWELSEREREIIKSLK